MSSHRKSLFVVSTDMGGTEALLPVLRGLQATGEWDLAIFALPDTPAERMYRAHGFEPRNFASYGYPRLDDIQAMRVILAEENPSLVLTSAASEDKAIDRLTLDAAQREGIPNAALIETWPNMWLARRALRDGPVYRRADILIVCDRIAFDAAVAHGFAPERIRICGNPLDEELVVQRERLPYLRRQARKENDLPEDALVIGWFATYDLDNETHRGETYEGKFGFGEAEAYREYLAAIREATAHASLFGRAVRGLHRQKPHYGHVGLVRIERELDFYVRRDTRQAGSFYAMASCDVICSLVGGISLRTATKLGIPGVFYQPGATLETVDDPLASIGVAPLLTERGALRSFILELAERPGKLAELRAGPAKIGVEPGAVARVIRVLKELAVH